MKVLYSNLWILEHYQVANVLLYKPHNNDPIFHYVAIEVILFVQIFGVYQILLPAGDGFEIPYIGESGSGATKAEGDSKGTSIKDRLNSHFTDMRDKKSKFLSISDKLEQLQVRFVRLDRLVTTCYEAWLIEKYEPICNSKGKILIK